MKGRKKHAVAFSQFKWKLWLTYFYISGWELPDVKKKIPLYLIPSSIVKRIHTFLPHFFTLTIQAVSLNRNPHRHSFIPKWKTFHRPSSLSLSLSNPYLSLSMWTSLYDVNLSLSKPHCRTSPCFSKAPSPLTFRYSSPTITFVTLSIFLYRRLFQFSESWSLSS